MRILIVEDEKDLAYLIRRGLTEQGYAVDVAHDGEEGQVLAESVPYDLIILDIILPKKEGFDVCLSLRRNKINTRILMLTAKGAVSDRVHGLDCGADDYLVKPFDFGELYARVRALLRRDVTHGSPVLRVGDLSLNTITREVKRGDRDIELTNKEYAILEYLARNPGVVITRQMLEDHVWNLSLDAESNVIEVYIRRLRAKLDEGAEESLIETVRGAGYRLRTK